jgi:hypothetical protein
MKMVSISERERAVDLLLERAYVMDGLLPIVAERYPNFVVIGWAACGKTGSVVIHLKPDAFKACAVEEARTLARLIDALPDELRLVFESEWNTVSALRTPQGGQIQQWGGKTYRRRNEAALGVVIGGFTRSGDTILPFSDFGMNLLACCRPTLLIGQFQRIWDFARLNPALEGSIRGCTVRNSHIGIVAAPLRPIFVAFGAGLRCYCSVVLLLSLFRNF